MQDERKLILNMVKDGKISEDEALKLLEALESPKMESDLEESAKTIASRFISGIDSALRKTSDVIQGLDVNDWSLSFGSNKEKTEKLFKTPFDSKKDLTIDNYNGSIQLYSWDNDYIETRASISYDKRKLDPSYDFILVEEKNDKISIVSNHSKLNNKFESRLSIAIPRTMEGSIDINSKNGSIELSFVKSRHLKAQTTNGSINLNAVSTSDASIRTTQGSISIVDFQGEKLSLNTTNGSLSIQDLDCKELDGQTINGSIKNADLSPRVKSLKLNTINGTIAFKDIDFSRSIKTLFRSSSHNSYSDLSDCFDQVKKKGNIFEATSSSYNEDDENTLLIDASTVNGKIKFY